MEPTIETKQSALVHYAKKPWVWAIVAAVIAAIIITIVVARHVGPDDYVSARDTMQKQVPTVGVGYNAVVKTTLVSPLITSKDHAKRVLDAADKRYDTYKQAAGDISGMQVRYSGDLAKQYQAYRQADSKFRQFADDYLPIAHDILPAVATCHAQHVDVVAQFGTQLGYDMTDPTPLTPQADVTSQSAVKKALKPCLDALHSVPKQGDKDAQKLVDALTTAYGKLADGSYKGLKLSTYSDDLDDSIDAKITEGSLAIEDAEIAYTRSMWDKLDDANLTASVAALQKAIDTHAPNKPSANDTKSADTTVVKPPKNAKKLTKSQADYLVDLGSALSINFGFYNSDQSMLMDYGVGRATNTGHALTPKEADKIMRGTKLYKQGFQDDSIAKLKDNEIAQLPAVKPYTDSIVSTTKDFDTQVAKMLDNFYDTHNFKYYCQNPLTGVYVTRSGQYAYGVLSADDPTLDAGQSVKPFERTTFTCEAAARSVPVSNYYYSDAQKALDVINSTRQAWQQANPSQYKADDDPSAAEVKQRYEKAAKLTAMSSDKSQAYAKYEKQHILDRAHEFDVLSGRVNDAIETLAKLGV